MAQYSGARRLDGTVSCGTQCGFMAGGSRPVLIDLCALTPVFLLTLSPLPCFHRRRLPQVFAGFKAIEWFGHDESIVDTAPPWQWTNQPVIVLRKTPEK